MKKICILKTGTAHVNVKKQFGDFEDNIIDAAGLPRREVCVASVCLGEKPPAFDDTSAVIVTGSTAMVTDGDTWSINTSVWLRQAIVSGIPVLGICYGHQLLAQALGGSVDFHPKGPEVGMTTVRLTDAGRLDPLFGTLPGSFPVYVVHSQTVTALPAGARLLGGNDFERHHAFSFGGHTWGVQFHPEFTADILKCDIENHRDSFAAMGLDVDPIIEAIKPNDFGRRLLRRFISLTT